MTTTQQRPATSTEPGADPHTLRAGPPSAAAAATPTAIALALIVVAVAVTAGRDALVLAGALGGSPWITPLLIEPAVLQRDNAFLLPIATAVTVIGAILLIVSVTPRRRTHRRLANDGVWMRKRDVATLIAATARAVPGVDAARTTGSNRRQRLLITPNLSAATDLPALRHDVDTAVTTALGVLDNPPKLATTLRKAPRP